MEVSVSNVNDIEEGCVDEELDLNSWVGKEEESDNDEDHSSAHKDHAVGDDVLLISSQAKVEGSNTSLDTRQIKLCPVLPQVVVEDEWA